MKPKHVIITDDELDCIAIAATTGEAAMCLPNGASSLPPGCLPFLESFTRWFTDGVMARKNLHRFAHKLQLSRCFMIDEYNSPAAILNFVGAARSHSAMFREAQEHVARSYRFFLVAIGSKHDVTGDGSVILCGYLLHTMMNWDWFLGLGKKREIVKI